MKRKIPVLIVFLLIISLFWTPFKPILATGLTEASSSEENTPAPQPMSKGQQKTILVRIRYVYDDAVKTVAAQSYEAYIPVGYQKVLSISSPEIKGYQASQPSVTLNFETYTEDTDIDVTYSPKTMPYEVEHKLENLTQDGFTLKDTEQLEAKVGSQVTAVAKAYEGFTPVRLQSEKIPAEGTLKLEAEYSRNSYTLSYDTDGGSYLPSEQRLFEEPLQDPTEPVKKGYNFGGWEPKMPASMPAEDLQLKAKWIPADETPFKYAYFLQNADDDNYTVLGYIDRSAKTNSPVDIPIKGAGLENLKLFPLNNTAYVAYGIPKLVQDQRGFEKYFVFNEEKTRTANKDKVVDGDGKTVVPLYFDRQVYTVAFGGNPSNFNNPNEFFPEIKKNGVTYTKDNPYKIQVRFGEDYSDRMPTGADVVNIPAGHVLNRPMYVKGTGYGSWMPAVPPYRFTAHMAYCAPQSLYDLSADPNFPYTQYISLTAEPSPHQLKIFEHFQEKDGSYKNLTDPTRIEGLSSSSWYYTPSNYMGFSPDGDKMDYYQQSKSDQNGAPTGEFLDPGHGFLIRRGGKPSLKKGDKILNADGSFKEFVQDGYDSNLDGVVHVYYARNRYPVTFYVDPDEQSDALKKSVVYEGKLNTVLPSNDEIEENKPNTLSDAYQFKGWYKDLLYQEKLGDAEMMGAKPLTLFAKWEPTYEDVTVTLKFNNGAEDRTETLTHGQTFKKALAGTPEKAGYTFLGWYLEEAGGQATQLYDFARKLTEDITLVAKYRKNTFSSVTLRFVDENGKPVAAERKTENNLSVGVDYTYKAALVDGMLPDVASKKVTVQADPDQNVLTFTYKPFKSINYTVRYVTRSLNSPGQMVEQEIAPAEQVTTFRNIDTRSFKAIPGYRPLTLQQTLQLSQTAADNVMTFVYVKDTPDQAEYKIEYYFDKDGSGKFVQDPSRDLVLGGDVGSTVTLARKQVPEMLDGCQLDREKSQTSGVITSPATLTLKLYYAKAAVVEPEEPTQPTQPTKPTQPTASAKPGTTNASDNQVRTQTKQALTRTGEMDRFAALGIGLLVCATAAVVVISKRKAKDN